jgi:hypothetical protein
MRTVTCNSPSVTVHSGPSVLHIGLDCSVALRWHIRDDNDDDVLSLTSETYCALAAALNDEGARGGRPRPDVGISRYFIVLLLPCAVQSGLSSISNSAFSFSC